MNANGHTDVLAFMTMCIGAVVIIAAVALPLSGGAWQVWLAVGLFLAPPVVFAARSARHLHRGFRRR